MITQSKIKQIKHKAKLPNTNNIFRSLWVFPLTIANTLDLTNVGMLQQQDNDLTNYQYSEKVDIGDKPLIVFWKNSQKMRNGKYFPVLYNPLDVDPPFQKDPIMMPIYNEIEYKIGDVLYGQYQNETSEIIVEEDNTFNDYKSIRKGQTITIRFENNNCYFNPKTKNISSELLDNFFWIESFGNKVFRIEEISETRDLENNEDILFWEITFSYTGNEFQKSGQSPMNFIQFSAPGMGYAFPKIVKKEDEFYKNVYIDEDVLKHPGITHAKLEKLGFSLQGTFSLMACEITDFTEEIQVDNKNNISNMGSITQPEQILGTENYRVILWNPITIYPYCFWQTETNNIYRKQSPSSNFGAIINSVFTMTADYDFWKDNIPNRLKANAKYEYEGAITAGSDIPTIGFEIASFYDDSSASGKVFSNNLIVAPSTTSAINFTNPDVDIFGIRGNATMEDGQNTIPPNTKMSMTFGEWMVFNEYTTDNIISFPTEQKVNLLQYVKDWPIIGDISNLVLGGVKLGVKSSTQQKFYDHYQNCNAPYLLGDTSGINFAKSIYVSSTENPNKIALETLKNGDKNKENGDPFSLTSSINYSFLFNFSKYIGPAETVGSVIKDYEFRYNSAYILKKDDDGNIKYIQINNPVYGEISNLTGSFAVALSKRQTRPFILMEDIKEITDGKKIPKKYVIFGFKDKSIFSGMNNLTFYNNENAYYLSNKTMNDLKPQWMFAFFSNAYWRNSLRDWTTFIPLSHLNYLPTTGKKVYFPAQISYGEEDFELQKIKFSNLGNNIKLIPKEDDAETLDKMVVFEQDIILQSYYYGSNIDFPFSDLNDFVVKYDGKKFNLLNITFDWIYNAHWKSGENNKLKPFSHTTSAKSLGATMEVDSTWNTIINKTVPIPDFITQLSQTTNKTDTTRYYWQSIMFETFHDPLFMESCWSQSQWISITNGFFKVQYDRKGLNRFLIEVSFHFKMWYDEPIIIIADDKDIHNRSIWSKATKTCMQNSETSKLIPLKLWPYRGFIVVNDENFWLSSDGIIFS